MFSDVLKILSDVLKCFQMFSGCSQLVTDIPKMFSGCSRDVL